MSLKESYREFEADLLKEPETLEERILRLATPKKGIDYFDGKDGKDGTPGKDGRDGPDGVDGRDGKSPDPEEIAQVVLERIPKPKDGKDGVDGRDGYTPVKNLDYFDGEPGQDGKDADPKAVIEEIKKLKGSDRMGVKDIHGLDEYVNGTINMRDQRWHGGGTTVRVNDLSSQLNGVIKTFTLTGSISAPISLMGTEFPNIYLPYTDYTWSIGSGTITLGSSVSAPAAGQSLLFVFAA